MPEPLEMSLDEIIRNKKKSSSASHDFPDRDSGTGHGPRPARHYRELFRMTPYSVPPASQLLGPAWSRGMLRGGVSTPCTKLYISNLEYSVSNSDIKVLFSEVGELKQYSIHYDKSGRSKGTAEIVFLRHIDALAAIERYNNVLLDGKPMKIEIIGDYFLTPAIEQPTVSGLMGELGGIYTKLAGLYRSSAEMSIARMEYCIRKGNLGREGGRGGEKGEKISAEDLDADLEKYQRERKGKLGKNK